MKLRKALCVLVLAGPAGCQTPDPARSTAKSAGKDSPKEAASSYQGALETRLAKVECPVQSVTCPKKENRVFCRAKRYDGEELKGEKILRVWGENPCRGVFRMAEEACKREWHPEKLAAVSCIPDASGGHCPVGKTICTTEYAPVTCTAHRYDGEPLSQKQRFKASGPNECRTENMLKQKACRRNLNPEKLEDIRCDPQDSSK